ncbi:MAG: nitroreductase family protein [Clostridiales bacterium]|jgi:nitroreductase|nr:nitroreductase family protein [Clostridiales bacterium]
MILDAIKKRKSIRSYDSNAIVSKEQIKELLEAAMLAPSACNCRPVEFIVVQNRELLNKITEIHPYTSMLKTASCAIIVCSNLDIHNDITKTGMYMQDSAAATENILIQAASMDLGTCWCGLAPNPTHYKNFRELLGLPESIEPFSLIAIGTPAEDFGSRGFYEEDKVTWM